MKSKGLEENVKVWTVGLNYDFREFDNSSDYWKIEGGNYRTAFCRIETTEMLSEVVLEILRL